MRKGICVAGNMVVDILYSVNGWPRQGELVHILDGISRATGGAVCNVIIDLAKLDPEMPLYAMGRNGVDPEGDLVMETMQAHKNINCDHIIREGVSAFTLAMNDVINKQRTFFTHLGSNGQFCEEDINWDKLDCNILHIGYILLLNALDQPDEAYGSKMARLLHHAQQHGIKTSIDVVSEAGDRFSKLVPPSLKYTDYCIINELEAGQTTSTELRDADNKLIYENIPVALKRMKEMGVSTWAVIHTPEGGFGLDENNNYIAMDSLHLPEGYIKGTVGAGDAFCAGVLCAAEKGMALKDAIILGIATAACSLSQPSASDGVRTIEETLKLYNEMR